MFCHLDDGVGQLRPPAQQVLELVPVLLQGPEVGLKLLLRLLVGHGEELPAQVQSVDETGLITLELQLGTLSRTKQDFYLNTDLKSSNNIINVSLI